MSRGQNPYAAPISNPGEAPDPSNNFIWASNRYAVPDIPESTDPEYTLGFSPQLKADGSPDGSMLPDDIRTGHREPPPNDPNQHGYNDHRSREFRSRHSVEFYSEGWHTKQEKIPAPRVPRWEQELAPTRPTADRSPSNYLFQRPWHIPRNIKDALGEEATAHFSLADHRRKYEIMGMRPQGRLGTNTYRASPRPWDENLFVAPQATDTPSPMGVPGNRSHRLT